MTKARKNVALKPTKCPVALLGRQLTATLQATHDLTDIVRDGVEKLRKANPRLNLKEAVSKVEGATAFYPREQALSTQLADTEKYASHVTATSIEGALTQIALAIETMGGIEDCGESDQVKEEAGRVVRHLVSAFHAIEKIHGFNPDSLISQHYVSYFE